MLRKSKSGRKGVTHKPARQKFVDDLDVIRRATCVVNDATGERQLRGGATPYAYPLEQVEFAIDKRWLTDGWENGDETGRYYYRLATGRREPHTLSHTAWRYEGDTSRIAFLNDKVRQLVQRARRTSQKQAA